LRRYFSFVYQLVKCFSSYLSSKSQFPNATPTISRTGQFREMQDFPSSKGTALDVRILRLPLAQFHGCELLEGAACRAWMFANCCHGLIGEASIRAGRTVSAPAASVARLSILKSIGRMRSKEPPRTRPSCTAKSGDLFARKLPRIGRGFPRGRQILVPFLCPIQHGRIVLLLRLEPSCNPAKHARTLMSESSRLVLVRRRSKSGLF
jgi:hypothetical protein